MLWVAGEQYCVRLHGAQEHSRHFRTHHWFPHEMTPDERAQKFHNDDVSLYISGKCFWLVVPRGEFASTNQKRYPDLGSDTPDVNSMGNQWWRLRRTVLEKNENKKSRKYVRGNDRSKWNLKLMEEGDREKIWTIIHQSKIERQKLLGRGGRRTKRTINREEKCDVTLPWYAIYGWQQNQRRRRRQGDRQKMICLY